MRAIALRDLRLVRESVDGGQDLNRPRPLSEAGLSHVGRRSEGSVLTPLELAVALEQPALAGLLVDGGADAERVATPLLCLTVFLGAPRDLARLRAKGLTLSPTLRCETPDADTLEGLARRNSDAMVEALQAAAPAPAR